MGVLHVQPENPAIRPRGIEDRDHLGQRVRFVDQHAKLRGLEANRSSDSSGRHGGQNLEVLPRRPEESRSEEHTSELQSRVDLVCRLLLEKKKKPQTNAITIS